MTDVSAIERVIGGWAESTGRDRPLVIKWMETPTNAFDHLSRLGLDALLDMGTASFWRGSQPSASRDVAASERAFEVRMLANELLNVQDAALTAPKLLAKSRAMSANEAAKEIFQVRAVSSQIGWLETSMADAAAQAVSNVELLLSPFYHRSLDAIGRMTAAADLILPPPAEGSAEVATRVAAARDIQKVRYAAAGLPHVRTNAEAPASVLEAIAQPDAHGQKLLRDAAETMRLSARGYHRVLRVARTLADLDGADKIGRLHLAEALSYRALAEDLRRAA